MKTRKTLFIAFIAISILLMVYSCMISIGTGLGGVTATTTTTVSKLSKHLNLASAGKSA